MTAMESLPPRPLTVTVLIVLISSLGYFFTRLYSARMLVIDRQNKGLVIKT
jgi:hypothetical protein